jgi:hypothetical protein
LDLFETFTPLDNAIGFGAVDFIELTLAILLVAMALLWRPFVAPFCARLARRPRASMAIFFVAPIALRLALLAHHPVPIPDLYDEFGHLLVADTLRHWRLANPAHPMHRFFETFFVLQTPTYSSIYPIGPGLALALGWSLLGTPWAGVLVMCGLLCALSYWMLRGWTTASYAFLGGAFAVMEFGPMNQWTNNYWGGGYSAVAGCLVFGALPRVRRSGSVRDAVLLGLGLAMYLLSRPYESMFLLVSVVVFLAPSLRAGGGRAALRRPLGRRALGRRSLGIAALVASGGLLITLIHNKAVTGVWGELPYTLSQYQYGVPAALTILPNPVPHSALTPQQETDYRMQRGFRPSGGETLETYFGRLFYRARYYRFYFYPTSYVALLAYLIGMRRWREFWISGVCLLFALGINFFPQFQFHYMAACVCLFLLMSVEGVRRIARLRAGAIAARALIFLCLAQFLFWYGLHLGETPQFAELRGYDMWDSINHNEGRQRRDVATQVAKLPGRILVFVRYWPGHIFRNEWVYNSADIDGSRVVWARDLGDGENQKLRAYYPNRTAWLFEPDARPPRLGPYVPENAPEQVIAPSAAPESPARPEKPDRKKEEKPKIELLPVQ